MTPFKKKKNIYIYIERERERERGETHIICENSDFQTIPILSMILIPRKTSRI